MHQVIKVLFSITIFLGILHSKALASTPPSILEIRYPSGSNLLKSDVRVAYENELFSHFPRYANKNQRIVIKGFSDDISFERSRSELATSGKINVIAEVARDNLPTHGTVIPIPIMKGLLGFRELIYHQDNQSRIQNINSISNLSRFTIGQGQGWAEIDIYKSNNLNVLSSADLPSLFRMLERKRFDLLPLGTIEVQHEYKINKLPGLKIHKDVMLYYPLPVALYVNRKDKELRLFLERALIKMSYDGTIDTLLKKHFSRSINKINSGEITIIELNNYNFPLKIPSDNSNFWLTPSK